MSELLSVIKKVVNIMSVEETIELISEDCKERMEKTIQDLQNSLSQVRTGRASAAMVNDIKVEVYGQMMPLNQVATVNVPEARMLTIDVWDKSNLQMVEKAILKSGRSLNPMNDGVILRINLPEMTEETRKEMTKIVKQKSEDHKVAIRNIRRDSNEQIKKLKSEGLSEDNMHAAQEDIQKVTDSAIQRIDQLSDQKEKDILTI